MIIIINISYIMLSWSLASCQSTLVLLWHHNHWHHIINIIKWCSQSSLSVCHINEWMNKTNRHLILVQMYHNIMQALDSFHIVIWGNSFSLTFKYLVVFMRTLFRRLLLQWKSFCSCKRLIIATNSTSGRGPVLV